MSHMEFTLEITSDRMVQTFTLEHVRSHKKWQGHHVDLKQILARLSKALNIQTVQIIDQCSSEQGRTFKGL